MTAAENTLVMCRRNSARSRMAEALLPKHGDRQFKIFSAGIEPAEIHPLAVQVMSEVDSPLDGHRSKGSKEYLEKLPVNHLIIDCARTGRECPKLFPGALRRHFWPFPDPAMVEDSMVNRLAMFRDVRDQIEGGILAWLKEPEADREGGHP